MFVPRPSRPTRPCHGPTHVLRMPRHCTHAHVNMSHAHAHAHVHVACACTCASTCACACTSYPWGVGSLTAGAVGHAARAFRRCWCMASKRDIAAAAHTQKSSGSPGPPRFRAWFVGLRPRPRRGTLSWPILTVGAPGNSPSDRLPLYNTFGVLRWKGHQPAVRGALAVRALGPSASRPC